MSVTPASAPTASHLMRTGALLVFPTHAVRRNHTVKPLTYGYVRITEDLDDEKIRRDLRKLAEAEGFCLIEIFSEYQPGSYGTFYR